MIGRPIIKSKLVSVKIPDGVTAQTIVNFPQDNEIDGRVLLGFSVYNDQIISVCPNGQAAIVELKQIAVTLKNSKSTKFIDNYPAFAANPVNVFGLYVAVQPFIISMVNCELKFFQNVGTLQNSVPVNLFYCELATFKLLSSKFNDLSFMLR